MVMDNWLFTTKNKKKEYEEEIEEQLWDDELSFEEAAFLMGYNNFS